MNIYPIKSGYSFINIYLTSHSKTMIKMNTSELFNLKGKTAIVTGGANGIGKATALILAKHGANISIGDFNLEDAKKTAKEIEELGVKAIAIECNVLKDEDLVNLIDKTVEELGGIQILINNAGGGAEVSKASFGVKNGEIFNALI